MSTLLPKGAPTLVKASAPAAAYAHLPLTRSGHRCEYFKLTGVGRATTASIRGWPRSIGFELPG